MENDTDKSPFEEEELAIALESGGTVYSLNNDNIKKAASNIFGKKKTISSEFYEKTVIPGNYLDFDLDSHGLPNLIGDLSLLTNYFRSAVNIVRKTTRESTHKVLFIGCGPGRLAIPAIELSKRGKFNIDEVVFNDLLPGHIDATREKIAQCYGTRSQNIDGVEISFESGDFLQVSEKIRKKFDVIFAMWFVTSEIADFSSTEALLKKRQELFLKIKKILTKQGVFVEDIPFSEGVGTYYYLARLKTYVVLNEMGILEGENNHMLLTDFTDIQETGFPYHLRYVPSNGKHRNEVEGAGFKEYESIVSSLPTAIKKPEKLKKEFIMKEIRKLFQRNNISNLLKFLKRKELEFLSYPNPTEEEAQLKKTILWRSNGY